MRRGRPWRNCAPSDRQRIDNGFERFIERHNPYIRTIVRRTREYLENTVDPATGEPYITPVKIRLHGESDDEAITLPPFLQDAYNLAEEFCQLLDNRTNAGLFRTVLLRRIGSTIEAGRLTVAKVLEGGELLDDDNDDETNDRLGTLTNEERQVLLRLAQAMETTDQDPKYAAVKHLLVDDGWIDRGCIVFSQYYDSVWWLANQLARELPEEVIGIYAGTNRSGTIQGACSCAGTATHSRMPCNGVNYGCYLGRMLQHRKG